MIITHEWETIREIRSRVAVDPAKLIKLLTQEFYARRLEICLGDGGENFYKRKF
jgi:hypothetical protein